MMTRSEALTTLLADVRQAETYLLLLDRGEEHYRRSLECSRRIS